MQQPTLKTTRLILNTFENEDVADIFGYGSDPEVAKYVPWNAHQSLKDSQEFLDYVNTSTCNTPGSLFLVFAIRMQGELIGSIDFKNVHARAGQIDYALSRRLWGKGIMTEAAGAVRDWSFDTFPEMVRLQSYCLAVNIKSSRVMEKIGMQFEGTGRKAMMFKGEPADVSHYAIVRDNFARSDL